MRALLKFVFAAVIVFSTTAPTLADKRVALVIGNGAYQKAAKLGTPGSDATAMATMFKSAGFVSVETRLDQNVSDMRRALREFESKAHDADIAVIYYSGYAVQWDGANYLLPVDAKIAREVDVVDEAVPLDRVLSAVGSSKKLGLVLLDASRETSLGKTFKRSEPGLARIEPNPGVLVSFAAKHGTVSADAVGGGNPYTRALLDNLTKPGIEIRFALSMVRDDVLQASQRRQEPYAYGSLSASSSVVLAVPAALVDQSASPATEQSQKAAAEAARLVAAAKAKQEQERLAAEQKAAEQAKAAEAARAKAAQSAAAPAKGRRIALVIGNSKYKNAPLLPNPQRDAALVADALKRTGFAEVTLLTDLGKEATISALQAFSRASRSADWAVIYYAGHGIEIGGINYLVPIDAKLETDRDVEFEAVPLNQMLNVVGGATKLRLVVLDACRINPFANSMKREFASRAVSRGFARQETNPGTLVVYAAKAGEIASDGNGANSPFSLAFAQNVLKPGVEISMLFRLVGDDVKDATQGTQTPFTYGELTGREGFYFIDPK